MFRIVRPFVLVVSVARKLSLSVLRGIFAAPPIVPPGPGDIEGDYPAGHMYIFEG